MNLELKILMVLGKAGFSGTFLDIDIAREGDAIFGKKWVIARHHGGQGYSYVPEINMALGRLRRRGLVAGIKKSTNSYSSWQLTADGYKVAQEL